MLLLLAAFIAVALVLLTSVLWAYVGATRELPLMGFEELHCCAGLGGRDLIYVAVNGVVYDVSGAPALYGPSGAYSAMAGFDVSRAMAKRSMSLQLFNGPIDDLNAMERSTLEHYIGVFISKYKAVARVRLPTSASWTPPLSTSASPQGFSAEGAFSLDALANNEQKRLVALNGVVYDVSLDESRFGAGGRFQALVGADVSLALAHGKLDPELFNRSLSCLAFDQVKNLNLFVNFFEERYPRVGVLVDGPTSSLLNASAPSPSQNTSLHLAIEKCDVGEVSEILRSMPSCINEPCSRSMMTPLHKAIEAGNRDIVRMLLDTGADTSMRALLYDNATAKELAARFRDDSIQAMLEA